MYFLDSGLTAQGGGGAMALAVALLLGLRHATDPDHLTAVSTLVLGERTEGRSPSRIGGARRAGWLGLAWGLGHAATMFAFGLPVVLLGRHLPEAVTRGAEVLVGVAIVALAARLLWRWRRGTFHSHAHKHGAVEHAHPHVHEPGHSPVSRRPHGHAHAESLGRSPLEAFGIGLLHGAGGSAAAGVLLVGASAGRGDAVMALALYAAGTALSMALVSTAFGYALVRAASARRVESWIPALSAVGLVFGIYYTVAALR